MKFVKNSRYRSNAGFIKRVLENRGTKILILHELNIYIINYDVVAMETDHNRRIPCSLTGFILKFSGHFCLVVLYGILLIKMHRKMPE